jgi:L-ascorbate metabolism protein UlaG (beta-lactamase superfamily)
LHLLLQRADGCADGCQLPFHAIPPEPQHAQFAFLMTPPAALATFVADAAAAKGGKHEKVGKCLEVLATPMLHPSAVLPAPTGVSPSNGHEALLDPTTLA